MNRHGGTLNAWSMHDSNRMTSGKGKTMVTVKTSVVARGGMRRWIGRTGVFLGQWKYSVWYRNYGYMSLYLCPNPQDVQHQEWTPFITITSLGVGFLRLVWCFSFVLLLFIKYLVIFVYVNVKWHWNSRLIVIGYWSVFSQ